MRSEARPVKNIYYKKILSNMKKTKAKMKKKSIFV